MSNPLALANGFNASHGLKGITSVDSISLDEKTSMRLADYYNSIKHEPSNPIVFESYRAFKSEILAQWNFAMSQGIVFEPTDKDPYLDSKSMIQDITANDHLKIFTGGDMPNDHPLSEIASNGLGYNVMFRGVHDLFGHSAHNNSFSATGEFRAYHAHVQMFSDKAKGALACETLLQNCWFNSGEHLRVNGKVPKKGEVGYIAPRNRPFAIQKANIYQ